MIYKTNKFQSVAVIFILLTSMLISHGASAVTNYDSVSDIVETVPEQMIDNQIIDDTQYSENEIIIMLAETDETQKMQFQYLYSDDKNTDLVTYNEENANLCQSITETEYISDQLNLGVQISEMRLLNPSQKKNRNSLYEIQETNNNIFSVTLDGTSIEEAIEILNNNPLVEIAEPNYYYESCDVSLNPNDEYYNNLYQLVKINALDAWETTTGSSDVTVGVIDTGIDGTHPDLINNLWVNPYLDYNNGYCTVCNSSDDVNGYNFTGYIHPTGKPGGGTPNDSNGHGTHVAGIIGAEGNNAIGVCGVNWNVSLAWLGVHVGNKKISSIAVIEALNYAENHNIMITNNSYGGYNYSVIFEQAISNYSGLFIASAGNDGVDNDTTPLYPASYECANIISVAATNQDNNLADTSNGDAISSNYGNNTVHVAAPGCGIYSTVPNSGYGVKSGTSMACPIVTGIAALIKANNPDFNAQQIKAIICGTTQNLGKEYNIINDGGIVNASSAITKKASVLRSVTFDLNYTNAPSPFVDYVFWAKKISQPRLNPQRSGYIFEGWYTTADCDTLFDFDNTTITTNITVYAKWTEVVEGSYGDLFPDYRFRDAVLELLNKNSSEVRIANTVVSSGDISRMAMVTELNISSMSIGDLTGLEYFTGLKILDCSKNRICKLDIKRQNKLQNLDCSFNQIPSFDVTNQSSLQELRCNNNLLTSISGLYKLTSLTIFDCSGNKLTSLGLSTQTNLQTLDCSLNKLSTLNVNNLSSLQILDCSFNNLYSLNVNSLTELETLVCSFNYLSTLKTGNSILLLDCKNNNLSNIDITDSVNITTLYCLSNKLTVLNTTGLSKLCVLDVRYNDMNEKSDVINYNKWDYPDTVAESLFEPQNSWIDESFSDVSEDNYYYKAIQYVYERDIMDSQYSTSFGSTATLTRSELAMIVYRMAGSPDVAGLTNPFTDVSSSASYINAVKWVYNSGTNSIMNGTSSTVFDPTGTVTREMLAVVLDRYSTRQGITFDQLRTYQEFADDSSIPSWAKSSVINMYRACIINGDENNKFNPGTTIQRKDVAVVVRRFEVIRLYL